MAGVKIVRIDQWVPAGSNLNVNANPSTYYAFSVWTGDVPGGQESNNPASVNMDTPKQLTATFTESLAVNDVPEIWLAGFGWTSNFDVNALDDQDLDGALTWQEYYAGTIPTNPLSRFQLQIDPEISGAVNFH